MGISVSILAAMFFLAREAALSALVGLVLALLVRLRGGV
jgi:hypothetical protein